MGPHSTTKWLKLKKLRTMPSGFIFDPGKCVRCQACSAACLLENGWKAHTREIYTRNEEALHGMPVINLSLACNHCENPGCLKSCPSGCYVRDEGSGAILINKENCMGCRYCMWNCPYDAPKFDSAKRIIEKCTLCYREVSAGEQPSCVTACPTGALGFGDLHATGINQEWFPENKLKPSLLVMADPLNELRIIPEDKFEHQATNSGSGTNAIETSLLIFTFLSSISVSLVSVSFLKGVFPALFPFLLFPVGAAVSSLFHLGKPLLAWKSLGNLRNSPLSREILFFIIFLCLSVLAGLLEIPVLLVCSSITGMILLLMIDNVYIQADRISWLHSGQTFFSALLLVSFFSEYLLPFTFIVVIKIILSSRLLLKKRNEMLTAMRYARIAILLVVWAGLISGFNKADFAMAALVISGEFIDRFLFYSDFQPVNIKLLLNRNTNPSDK